MLDELRGHGRVLPGQVRLGERRQRRRPRPAVGPRTRALRSLRPTAGRPGRLARLQAWSMKDAPLGPLTPPSLLVTEPPDHTRYRKLVSRVFSVRAVERLRVRTQQIADRPARPARPDRADRPRHDVLQPAAGHRDRGDPRRPGTGPREGAALRRRGCSESRPRAVLAGVPPCRVGAARVRRLAGAPPRQPAADIPATTCSASSSPPRRTASASPTPSSRPPPGWCSPPASRPRSTSSATASRCWPVTPSSARLLAEREELWPNAVDEVLRIDPPVLLTGRMTTADTEVAGVPMPTRRP